MILSNETILTIIISITVSILLAGLCLNYYLQKKQNKISNEQNTIYFLSIENIETGYLYEKFISINIPTQNHGSELNSSFIINEIKLKILSLKEEINKNTNVDINDLKVININKLN